MDLLGTVGTHLATVFVYFSCDSVEVVYVTSNESDPVAVLGEKSTKNKKVRLAYCDRGFDIVETKLTLLHRQYLQRTERHRCEQSV